MKITIKEAKIYTTDDFKAAAEEERFKNRAEIWADQFNAHAEYIGLKDRARVEKDIHGCDSVVWDYGYIVAKDPFGDKWQVRFGDNAYTMDKNKVTLYVYKQMDSMTGFKGEAYSDYKPLMDKVYDWYEKKNFWKEEDFWKDLEALYAHNYPNVGFKFVFKGDDECAEIYTKDGLLFTYSWKPVGRDRRFRVLDKDGHAIMKHPGFNFKDNVYYAYRGITGKDLAAEWYEKVSESREYPVNLYITTRYDDADAAEQFLKELGGEDITVFKSRNGDGLYVSVEGDGVDAFLDVYRERFDDIVKSCDVDANGWTDPRGPKILSVGDAMKIKITKALESKKGPAKKQERQGYADYDVRLNGEDIVFVVTGVTTEDRGYNLAVSVKEGETYTLDELGYEISGMCENCNGYPTATRMDDILVVAIQAPIENDEGELTEDYWDAVVIEGYVKVVGDKLDDVAAYLEG